MGLRLRLLTLSLAAAFATPALAQIESREGIELQNQILELRQEISQLQQYGSQGGGGQGSLPPPQQEGGAPVSGAGNDVLAGLTVRVSALEEQVRTLEGRVSELENTEHRDHDDLAKQIGDLSFKLGQGGAAPGGGVAQPDGGTAPALPQAPQGLTGPAPRPPAAAAVARRAPELALKQGYAALARGDYANAETAAREVLASHSASRAGDANYLLARAEAGQHEYKDAAATYYSIYKANPRAPRAASSLLGVANALIALGDNAPACQALAKVSVEFPHDGSVRSGVASARKRAACH